MSKEYDKLNDIVIKYFDANLKDFEKEIVKKYLQMQNEINNTISDFYIKYADEKGSIPASELNKFRRTKILEAQIQDNLKPYLKEKNDLMLQRIPELYDESIKGSAWLYEKYTGGALIWDLPDKNAIEFALNDDNTKIKKPEQKKDDKEFYNNINSTIMSGLRAGLSYQQMANEISGIMGFKDENGNLLVDKKGEVYKSIRIARTEGQKAQVAGQLEANRQAKAMGIDLTNKWNALIDNRTRETHAAMDGQLETENGFEWQLDSDISAGSFVPAPTQTGVASEDINCRCYISADIQGYKIEKQFELGDIPAGIDINEYIDNYDDYH